MLNRVIIMGRLTRDPELRMTTSGISVTSFTLAVDRNSKSQNEERATDFFDCIAWRNTADFVSKYFTKGRMAVVDGRLQTETWTDKNDKSHKSVKIIAENVYFGDSKKETSTQQTAAPYSTGVQSSFSQQDFTEVSDVDDDLPF